MYTTVQLGVISILVAWVDTRLFVYMVRVQANGEING